MAVYCVQAEAVFAANREAERDQVVAEVNAYVASSDRWSAPEENHPAAWPFVSGGPAAAADVRFITQASMNSLNGQVVNRLSQWFRQGRITYYSVRWHECSHDSAADRSCRGATSGEATEGVMGAVE